MRKGRALRVVGFDDAPFAIRSDERVMVAGVVCHDTRFEGMVWGQVSRDGLDATAAVIGLLESSKFRPQLHAVLIDGVCLAGFNVVDLEAVWSRLSLPCIAVMRRPPDLGEFHFAMGKLPDYPVRRAMLTRAGPIHRNDPFYFQVRGLEPEPAAALLHRVTDRGHVPEALRLAHLIGAAVMRGESSKRA